MWFKMNVNITFRYACTEGREHARGSKPLQISGFGVCMSQQAGKSYVPAYTCPETVANNSSGVRIAGTAHT